jgi:truncated hemoglobin YjbI
VKNVTYEEAKNDLNHATQKQEGAMSTQDLPSLYERLGGVYSIATVVDDLIDRVMVDPRLNANPLVDEAHHKVPPAGFKYLVTEMLCWAAGGPQKYTGKDMKSSHQSLRITPGEWDAFSRGRGDSLTSIWYVRLQRFWWATTSL